MGPREANQRQPVIFEARPIKSAHSPVYGYRWQVDSGPWDTVAPVHSVTITFDRDGKHTVTLVVWKLINNKREYVGRAEHPILVCPVGRIGTGGGR